MSGVDFSYLRELVESGRIDEAVSIAKAVEDPEKRSWALLGLVTILSQHKKFREALRVARLIEDEIMYSWSLSEITRYMLLYDRLSEAIGIAMMIPHAIFRLTELVTIASALVKKDRVDEAVLVINEALKTLKKLPKEEREWLEKRDSTDRKSTLETLSELVRSVLKVNIEIPRRVVYENEDLEVIIHSNIEEIENALVEFEGLDIKPVRLERLKDCVLKLRPPFEPGEKRLRVIVSFDIIYESYLFVREFVLEFRRKPLQY